ncbi:MAG TPA: hypothetical protein VNY05_19080 [Candidatus Acidoferrales bacterium]|jgi:hypothetical protein|nr:hypothetical protein [Candidatus Acidoferrales bacterium]
MAALSQRAAASEKRYQQVRIKAWLQAAKDFGYQLISMASQA